MKGIKLLTICSSLFLLVGCSQNKPTNSGDITNTGTTNTDTGTTDTNTNSQDSSNTDTNSEPSPAEWRDWSNETSSEVQAFLTKASSKEREVKSNTILNGLVSGGEQAYSEYSFRKGKRSNGDIVCYHKTPTQTTYYYHENGVLEGYIEKGTDSKTYSKVSRPTENKFNGYDMSSLMVKSSGSACGGYESLSLMVQNGSGNTNKDTKVRVRDNGFDMKYALYSKVTYTYWSADISADFDSAGALVSLKYTYAEAYAKTVDKHDDGTFTFKSDATLDFKETIYNATFGELDSLEPSVEPANFYYSSFDLYLNDSKVENNSTINTSTDGNGIVLDVKNLLPSTASDKFDDWVISSKKSGGSSTTDGNYFDSDESKIYITSIRSGGTYEVSIKTKNVTKTFTLVIGELHAESVVFVSLKEDSRGFNIVETPKTVLVGETTNVCAYIEPTGASQELLMEITTPEGVSQSDYTFTKKTYKTTDITLTYYQFSSTKSGDFVFKATAVNDPEVFATYTLSVIKPLTMDEIFSGKYCIYSDYYKRPIYTFEFTPNESTPANDGECKITTVSSGKFGCYTYSASATSKTISLKYKTGVEGTVEDLFSISVTTGGTRSSVTVSCSDDPVGWATTYQLLDWEDYLAKYGE